MGSGSRVQDVGSRVQGDELSDQAQGPGFRTNLGKIGTREARDNQSESPLKISRAD